MEKSVLIAFYWQQFLNNSVDAALEEQIRAAKAVDPLFEYEWLEYRDLQLFLPLLEARLSPDWIPKIQAAFRRDKAFERAFEVYSQTIYDLFYKEPQQERFAERVAREIPSNGFNWKKWGWWILMGMGISAIILFFVLLLPYDWSNNEKVEQKELEKSLFAHALKLNQEVGKGADGGADTLLILHKEQKTSILIEWYESGRIHSIQDKERIIIGNAYLQQRKYDQAERVFKLIEYQTCSKEGNLAICEALQGKMEQARTRLNNFNASTCPTSRILYDLKKMLSE